MWEEQKEIQNVTQEHSSSLLAVGKVVENRFYGFISSLKCITDKSSNCITKFL